jgi:hypothetical protein
MDEQITTANPTPLRFECQGCRVDDHWIPPFQLHAGEAICLHILPGFFTWHDTLVPALRGEKDLSGLRVHGKVEYLARPTPQRGWFGRRRDSSAHDWLTLQKGLSEPEAEQILERVRVPGDVRIGWMGWNERTLLAVEAILCRPLDVLIFDTAGNDPFGSRHLVDRLTSRPENLSLIYLKTVNHPDVPCLSGSTCLEIRAQPIETAFVE